MTQGFHHSHRAINDMQKTPGYEVTHPVGPPLPVQQLTATAAPASSHQEGGHSRVHTPCP